MRRAAVVLVLAAAWLAAMAAPAWADPPGPTDYRTEVTAIEPVTPGIAVEIIGGDSFVALRTDPGLSVVVVGYRGEPYLRFLPDGTVEENRNSPTTYLNVDRFAEVDVPDDATPDAVADWTVVASDGTYAWHDHRAHWMNTTRPPGRGPGDVILEGVVPLVVDGVDVDVAVASIWEPAPSPLPVTAGLAGGLGAVVAMGRSRRIRVAAGTVAAVATLALVVGIGAYLSVPPETGPAWSLWVPPAIVLVLAAAPLAPGVVGRAVRDRVATVLVLAGVVLVVWGVLHWEWLWRAILPTALPAWGDRVVTAAALPVGAGAAALAVWWTVSATEPRP